MSEVPVAPEPHAPPPNPPPSDTKTAAADGADDRDERRDRAIELLRDQVDQLQIQAGDKKKPWYRDRSLILSITSLLLTLTLSLFAIGERLWVREAENVDKQLALLRDAAIKLAELQMEFQKLGPATPYAVSTAFNAKRQLLLQSATAFMSPKLEGRIPPHVYLLLAYHAGSDGHYGEAEDYLFKAVRAAETIHDDLIVMQSKVMLANMYRLKGVSLRNQTPEQLRDLSRRTFVEAVAPVVNRDDDLAHSTVAEALLFQARAEIAFGDVEFGNARAAEARARAARMWDQNPGKAALLRVLDELERGPAVPSAPTGTPEGRQLEIWPPVSGLPSGSAMEVVIDGASKGKLSNLGDQLRIDLGTLTPGAHTFELRDIVVYMFSPPSPPTMVANGLKCAGSFVSGSSRVLKLMMGPTPTGLQCAIQ